MPYTSRILRRLRGAEGHSRDIVKSLEKELNLAVAIDYSLCYNLNHRRKSGRKTEYQSKNFFKKVVDI